MEYSTYPVYHIRNLDPNRQQVKPCLGIACYVYRRKELMELQAANVVKLDGTNPRKDEPMFCGTCSEPIHPSFLSYDKPVNAIIVV